MALGTSGSGAAFDTAGYSVTLTGSLSGPGSLTKVDSGTLTLATADTFAGNTLIGGGTLALGSPLALQNSTLDSSGSGILSFGSLLSATLGGLTGPGRLSLGNTASVAVALSVGNNDANTTYSGVLQGPGSLTKVGTGMLTLSGSSNYSGGTTINQGDLVVNGSLASPVTVNSGGTLGGTGSLNRGINVLGGCLNPGGLNTGALIIAGNVDFQGGNLDIVGAGSSISSVSITGNLSLNDATTLDFSGSLAAGPYTIATYGGTLSGQFMDVPAGYAINYGTGGNSSITLTAVPEPSTCVLIGVGSMGLFGWAWRRRKRNGARRSNSPVAMSSPRLHPRR